MATLEVDSFVQLKRVAFKTSSGASFKYHTLGRDPDYVSVVYFYSVDRFVLAKYIAGRTEIPVTDDWIQTDHIPNQDGEGYSVSLFPSLEVIGASQ